MERLSKDVFVLKERSSVRVYGQTGNRVLDCGSSVANYSKKVIIHNVVEVLPLFQAYQKTGLHVLIRKH